MFGKSRRQESIHKENKLWVEATCQRSKLGVLRNDGSQARGFDGGLYHRFKTHAGIQHEMVEAVIGPVAIVKTANIRGATLVSFQNFLFGVFGVIGKILLEPLHLTLHGSMHEDMKDTGSGEQGACRPTSDNDAMAGFHLLLEIIAHELDHAFGVKEFRVGSGGQPLNGAMPEGFAEAVIPGVEALVTAFSELFGNACFFGYLIHQALIDKFPLQIMRKMMSKGRSLTAVLAFHCNDSNHRVLPLCVWNRSTGWSSRPECNSVPKLDHRGAGTTFRLPGLADGSHMRMALQHRAKRAPQNAHPRTMYDADARQSGKIGAVEELFYFICGLVHGAANQIDFRAQVIRIAGHRYVQAATARCFKRV